MDKNIEAKPKVDIVKEEKVKHLLQPGEVGLTLELVVTDKDGKVTEQHIMKSKSFVRQFLELLWVHAYPLSNPYPQSIRDTGNALRNIYANVLNFASDAAIGASTYGIQVGTGVAAPTISDYKIQTQIAHGVGAGQLQYGAVTFGAPAWDATTSQFTVTRNFANASGGAITVNEIALVVLAADTTDTTRYFLIIRDVIAGGIPVPNGQTLTVNYRPQATI